MIGGLLFRRFAEQLKNEIAAERYPVGSILPSIAQLQKRSGLSRNTVVAALKLLADEGIIQRVGAARYGYTVVTRTLQNEKQEVKTATAAIALVFPFRYNNYVGSQLLQAIESALASSSIKLFIRNHENLPELEHEILESFLNRQSGSIDGIILMTTDSYHNPNLQLIRDLSESIPTVLLDRYIFGLDIPFVGLNNRRAGRDAAARLIACGHSRFGFVSGFRRLSPTIDRLEGFRESAKRHSIELHETDIFIKDDEINILDHSDDFPQLLRSQLNLEADGPTAYFCGDDKSALVLLRVLKEKGKRVPEDISVIGSNDDGFVHAASDYDISSYRYPFMTIAEEAVRILSAGQSEQYRMNLNIEVSPEFMDRGTVRQLPSKLKNTDNQPEQGNQSQPPH